MHFSLVQEISAYKWLTIVKNTFNKSTNLCQTKMMFFLSFYPWWAKLFRFRLYFKTATQVKIYSFSHICTVVCLLFISHSRETPNGKDYGINTFLSSCVFFCLMAYLYSCVIFWFNGISIFACNFLFNGITILVCNCFFFFFCTS